MSESLRDQLLKSGLVKQLAPAPRPPAQRPQAGQSQRPRSDPSQRPGQNPSQRPPQKPQHAHSQRPAQRPPGTNAEIDLAKAYALRERNERAERDRERAEAERRGREKKERRQKVAALLGGKAMNDAAAEIPRHFPHANKIRRIYVTAEQLPRLNGGELAVVQQAGRYLLVERAVAEAVRSVDADALVLVCDAQAGDDDGIPADLIW